MDKVLVQEFRNELLEAEHRGYICIVNDKEEVIYEVGNSNFMTYFRSSAKPIQAIPVMKGGIKEKYDIADKDFVIMTASHRAQPCHVEAVERIMGKMNIKDEDFVCLPTYPLMESAKEELLKNKMPMRSIYHNCSGKHLGIMALCRLLDVSIEDYYKIENKAQQEILEHMSLMAHYPKEDVKIGIDGCGVPVFAMPLKNLAISYMRMACPDLIEDEVTSEAVEKITKLMNKYPEMVSGTNLICPTLLKDLNIVAKGGAKGTYCFGLRKERLGISIKLMDGTEEPWHYIIAEILEQIGYENKETIKRLKSVFPAEIRNATNEVVGINKCTFSLKK